MMAAYLELLATRLFLLGLIEHLAYSCRFLITESAILQQCQHQLFRVATTGFIHHLQHPLTETFFPGHDRYLRPSARWLSQPFCCMRSINVRTVFLATGRCRLINWVTSSTPTSPLSQIISIISCWARDSGGLSLIEVFFMTSITWA